MNFKETALSSLGPQNKTVFDGWLVFPSGTGSPIDCLVFVDESAMLRYLQTVNKGAKHLRLIPRYRHKTKTKTKTEYSRFYAWDLYNWTTPVFNWYGKIFKVYGYA